MSEVARQIAGFPIVTCDIFDTALVRRLARPEDTLLAVGARARARGLVACEPEVFRECRLEAERTARAAAEAAGHDEVTIAEVYARLPAYGLLAVPTEDQPLAIHDLAALEFAVERSACQAAEPLRAVLAGRCGAQRLIFVSDTMLPGAWLATLLRDGGYGEDCTVFSSADTRRSKHTGRLFAHVLATLGCAPGDVVHLGDNPVSDVARARAHGITALHLPQRGRPPEPERVAKSHIVTRLVHSYRRSLAVAPGAIAQPGVPQLHRYLTALLIGFTLFVFAEAKRRNIRRLYFLSRDGYLPFAIAKRLAARLPEAFALEYLHVSRRSIAVPAQMDDLPRLADEVADSSQGQPLGNALEFLGVDAAETAALLRDLGINPERKVTRDFGREEIRRLFTARRDLILERLAARRSAALSYLDQTGFLTPGPRLIVDVGWRGTTQEALARLTGLPGTDIFGCYLGLWQQALRPAINLQTAAGYLFSFGHPRPLMEMVLDGYIVLELFFSAPQSTVLHYDMEGGRAVPVHAAEQEPDASIRRSAVGEIEAGCLHEFEVLDQLLDGAWPEAIDPASAALDMERLLTRPTAQEVAAINSIPFIQGINGARSGIAVNPIPLQEWRHPNATLRRIERAAWRAGAARASLPWPIPSMTYQDLRYRVGRLRGLFGKS